ncbi:MAG: hypothetical protein KGI57_08810 [Hyphomicrobiales bacterium]|nr:hypothetical protein [Hyphomicrobiales bacterium]MDE2017792.1 hypothetical protein [Hyphomicrobiales bacterium]
MRAPWYRPFQRAFRATCYLVAHTLVALVIIAIVEVIRHAINAFGDPRLLDFLPLSYIFDAVDIAQLLVFLIFGTREAIREFRGEPDE